MDPTGKLPSSFSLTTLVLEPFSSNQANVGDARIEAIMQQVKELQDALKVSVEKNNLYEEQIQTLERQVAFLSTSIFTSLAAQAQQALVLKRRIEILEDSQGDELSGIFSMTSLSERSNRVCLHPVEISDSSDENKKPEDVREIKLLRPASEGFRAKKISKATGTEFTEPLPVNFSGFEPFSVGLNDKEKTKPPRKIVNQLTDGMVSHEGRREQVPSWPFGSEEKPSVNLDDMASVKRHFDFSSFKVNNENQDPPNPMPFSSAHSFKPL